MAEPGTIRSMSDLKRAVARDPDLQERLRSDPVGTLERVVQVPDTPVYRMVIWFLGASIVISLLGALALLLRDGSAQVPDILIMVSSGALGALAGLLAPQPQ